MASCDKDLEVAEAPDFSVTTESTTYKAGEEIKFNISGGDANLISFYSGEPLKDYNFTSGRVIDVADAGATMSFSSSVQVGSQADQLSVLYSTDFNGDYSSLASVKAATWTDITDEFKLGTSNKFLASGTLDISSLVVPGKPIYFAYKYVTKPQATNGLARQWFIQSFVVNSKEKLDGKTLTIADLEQAGFRIVDENPETAPARASITTTRVTLYGNEYLHAGLPRFDATRPEFDPKNPMYDPNSPDYVASAKYVPFVPFDPTSPYNDPLSEHWAITKPITIDKIDLGPDLATGVKGIRNPIIKEYRYTYNKPGTYTAVFVASNNSIDDVKQVVQEITFTITP